MNDLIEQEWYQELIEECKAIIVEAVFTSTWALVEGYWNLGKRIREDNNVKEFAKGSKTFVQELARNLKKSERLIYYSLQVFDEYPSLDLLPEGVYDVIYGSKRVVNIAKDLKTSASDIWACIRFYKKFPEFSTIGRELSWHYIANKNRMMRDKWR